MFWEDILDDITRMQRQMNNLINNIWREAGITRIREEFKDYRKAFSEIDETEKEYLISVELPGIEKEDISLVTTDRGIEIKAEKKKEEKKESEEGKSYRKSYAGFYQVIDLPENAELNKIKASYKNGILKITVPKKETKIKKKIKVE